jgi:hypothetical protein
MTTTTVSYFELPLSDRVFFAQEGFSGQEKSNCTFRKYNKSSTGERKYLTNLLEKSIGEKKPNDRQWCVGTLCTDKDHQCINPDHAFFYHKENDKDEVKDLFDQGIFNEKNIPNTVNKSYIIGNARGTHNTQKLFTCVVCEKKTKGPLGHRLHEDKCLRLANEERVKMKKTMETLPVTDRVSIETFRNDLIKTWKSEDPKEFICKTIVTLVKQLPEELKSELKFDLIKERVKQSLDNTNNVNTSKQLSDAVQELEAYKLRYSILNKNKKMVEEQNDKLTKRLQAISSYALENI